MLTPNSYDDDFEFALGSDIESARKSAQDLLTFMETNPLKTSITVEDEDGRTLQINLAKRNTITLQVLDGSAIAVGNVEIRRSNIERTIALLDNKAERKVQEAIAKNNK